MIRFLPSLNNFGKTSVLFLKHVHKGNQNKIALSGSVLFLEEISILYAKELLFYVV